MESTEDRYIRTQPLIADLRRRAETCENPQEQVNLRRSVDSLIRMALALAP
ncbi:hypothetical protein [Kribbella ginsengisoli]|uniref:Uncharacterized protein n=1 Tax=Kribbella ginsengisoli TaxID=363865 RepID=A0ABP6XQ14_9ACTN